jgi:hypothetical protein
MKTAARIRRMIADIPVIWFVKYKTAIAIATSILAILSAVPGFFFICLIFLSMKSYTAKLKQ